MRFRIGRLPPETSRDCEWTLAKDSSMLKLSADAELREMASQVAVTATGDARGGLLLLHVSECLSLVARCASRECACEEASRWYTPPHEAVNREEDGHSGCCPLQADRHEIRATASTNVASGQDSLGRACRIGSWSGCKGNDLPDRRVASAPMHSPEQSASALSRRQSHSSAPVTPDVDRTLASIGPSDDTLRPFHRIKT